MSQNQKRFSFPRTGILSVMAAVLAISLGTSVAFARYVSPSNTLDGNYIPAPYDSIEILDTMTQNPETGLFYKSGVRFKVAQGNYPVYIRVKLIVTWQDSDGNIYGEPPILNTDYTIAYDTEHWNLADGYYYYTQAVNSGTTVDFMNSDQKMEQKKSAPTGYTMHIEVLAETVQAVGHTQTRTAVMDAWGVQPD